MDWEEGSRWAALIVTVAAFLSMSATSGIKGQVLGVVFLTLVVWSLFPQRHFETSIAIIAVLSFPRPPSASRSSWAPSCRRTGGAASGS